MIWCSSDEVRKQEYMVNVRYCLDKIEQDIDDV